MKKVYNSIFFMLTFFVCIAQNQHKVYQNFVLENKDKEEITQFISDYVNGIISKEDAFTMDDKTNYKTIDVYSEALSLRGSLYQIVSDLDILSIKQEGENYIASTLFYWQNNEEEKKNTITTLAIVDFWIKKENKTWKLSNYIDYHTRDWSSKKVDNFQYYYHPNHPFDITKANFANSFYNNLCLFFEIPKIDSIKYYITENCDKVYQLFGFDYFIGEGSNNNLCAFYDANNEIVASSTAYGEAHLHEIIHVINSHFPNSHYLLLTGLSCYINDASSKNESNFYHFERFEKYIETHELDFEKFEDFENIDEIVSFQYITGPLLCNAIYRQGGKKLLLDYLNNTKDFEVFKSKLRKDFKIKSFKDFFLNEIKIYKKQGKSLLYF